MLVVLFGFLMCMVFGRLLLSAIKASWGIAKILISIVFFPLVIIGLVAIGLIYIAMPILVLIGIGTMIKN